MTVQCRPCAKRRALAAILVLLSVAIASQGIQSAQAQTKKTHRAPSKAAPPRKQRSPRCEDVTLHTKDGVELHCVHYPGPETKQTVPMILIHDWDGSRKNLDPIARWMQQALKLTVIVPDLRGHGRSVKAEGHDQPIDRSQLEGRAIDAMIWDIEACKSFLLKKNNEGKLNIEQLGILGSGFGAFLALKWSVRDWSVPDLPALKQGRDVKALILASPCRSFRGATADAELENPRIWSRIATLTIVGREQSRSVREAKRVYRTFERAWPDKTDQGAPYLAAATPMQGTKLLMSGDADVVRGIAMFINDRLIQLGRHFPWTDRTSPLQ